MKRPIIALLTDFGTSDIYVAEMKAVILSICPEAEIVDITHDIPKFNIRLGAIKLLEASRYFPEGTIHVGVVDPGVGTARRPIIVHAERHLYVGPDNGLLIPAAMQEGIKAVYHIENRKYLFPKISRTFHGRDIFAPTAAHLALGVKPSDFGRKIDDYVVIDLPKPRIVGNSIEGEILYIDQFGNSITNISEEMLHKIGIKDGCTLKVELEGREMKLRLVSAYGDAEVGEVLTIIGDNDLLEVSINRGNAAKSLNIKVGDRVRISLAEGRV